MDKRVVIAVAVASFGGGLLAGWCLFDKDQDGGTSTKTKSPIAPAEYLYLDNARVAAYLAQERGGTVSALKRSLKETDELSAKAKAGEILEVGASSQLERFVEETVSPTAASSFTALVRELKSHEHLEDYDAGDPSALEGLKEGRFVSIKTGGLLHPSYSEPYTIARQAATLRALFPTSRKARAAARSFIKQVGPNPRMTFAVEASQTSGPRLARYLLPLQYQGLADERSLFAGRHTIIAKVVRVFPETRRRHVNDEKAYVDTAARETWDLPLRRVPSSLLKHLVTCTGTKGKARRCLHDKLENQTSVSPPGAVLIPVAIYK